MNGKILFSASTNQLLYLKMVADKMFGRAQPSLRNSFFLFMSVWLLACLWGGGCQVFEDRLACIFRQFHTSKSLHTFSPCTVWVSKLFSVSFTVSISISVTQIVRPCLNINIAVTVLFIIIHREHNTFASHRFAYMSNSFSQTEDYCQSTQYLVWSLSSSEHSFFLLYTSGHYNWSISLHVQKIYVSYMWPKPRSISLHQRLHNQM